MKRKVVLFVTEIRHRVFFETQAWVEKAKKKIELRKKGNTNGNYKKYLPFSLSPRESFAVINVDRRVR